MIFPFKISSRCKVSATIPQEIRNKLAVWYGGDTSKIG
jgi:hypothetical protein